MSLCLLAGGTVTELAAVAFTLAWQHSVERTEWRETWRVTSAGLLLEEARVKGSGAGMEPGHGARLEEGWWVWSPPPMPVGELRLAASGATGGGWRLCAGGSCRELAAEAAEPVVLRPCGAP